MSVLFATQKSVLRAVAGAIVLLAVSMSACPTETTEPPEDVTNVSAVVCPPGWRDCACLPDGQCNAGLMCADKACVADPACPEGSDGCACMVDFSCDTELTCNGGGCTPPTCAPGAQGCECAPGGTCGASSTGELMTCSGGRCEAESCSSGTMGCACTDGVVCDSSEATCVDGFCMRQGCEPGQLFCSCVGGGCSTPIASCQGGVICGDTTGFESGPCLPDGTCQRGNRCVQSWSDGTAHDAFVQLPPTVFDGLDAFTVSLWMRAFRPSGVVSAGGPAADDELLLALRPDGVAVQLRGGNTVVFDGALHDGKWHHLTLRRAANRVWLDVDGRPHEDSPKNITAGVDRRARSRGPSDPDPAPHRPQRRRLAGH